MMFPMVLPVPRTSASFGAGFPPCFLWQTGSAFMSSGLSAGAFPAKMTVPVMVDAATAMLGQASTATSPAARHNLFPVPGMLSSLVIANLASLVVFSAVLSAIINDGFLGYYILPSCGGLYTGPSSAGKLSAVGCPALSTLRRGTPVPTSDVLERERFGQPRVAQRYERVPSHQPARRRHEAPADGNECGGVKKRRTEPLRV